MKDRIQREQKESEKKQSAGGEVYLPKEEFAEGVKLVFPAMGGEAGVVTAVRDGKSYGDEAFKVIEVEFEEGDIHRPIWVGTFWQQESDVPEDAAREEPTTRLFQTKSGHILQFDDEEGKEQFRLFHPAKAEMLIDKNGTISLTDTSGAVLRMDAENNEIIVEDANGNILTMNSSGTKVEDSNGNVIEMAAAGITAEAPKIVIKGSMVHLGDEGGEPVIKGQSFLSMFATHIHTVAPVVGGPTSPPIPQGEMSTLSTTVKTI